MADNLDDKKNEEKIKLSGRLEGYAEEMKEALSSWGKLGDYLNRFEEIDDAVKGIAKNLGISSERFGAMKVAIVDSAMGIFELGGTMNDVVKLQEEYSKTLGRNVTMSEGLAKSMYAATQATGAEVGTIVKSFRDVGINTKGAVEGMQKVVEISHKSGVNAKQVSDQVLSNMGSMNKFTFQGGVEGMAKMAAQAVSLRVNMSDTLKIAEELFQPEKAIEMAAAMQRLGVAQGDLLDPLRLMDLAQNDPAELQNQIVKMTEQFVRMNEKGQFEIMPGARRQLMEISKELGINYDELTKMALGSADLSKKMSEIKFPSSIANEETRQMIANLAEVGDSGTYEVKYTTDKGETVTKKVSELGPDDIKALEKQQKESGKSLEDVAKEQLTMQKSMDASLKQIAGRPGYALAPSKTATETIDIFQKAAGLGPKMLSGEQLSTKTIREKLGGEVDSLMKNLGDLASGEQNMSSFLNALGKSEENLQTWGSDATKEVIKNTIDGFDNLGNKSNQLANVFTETIKKVLGVEKISTNTTNVQDFIIPLEQDQLRVYDNAILGGTNLDGGKGNNTMSEMKIDFNLNVSSDNPQIDTNQLLVFMEKQEFKQKMMTTLKDAVTNGKTGQIGNMVSV